MTQELDSYIRQQRQLEVSNEDIKKSLIANGWREALIEQAFARVDVAAQDSQSGVNKVSTGTNDFTLKSEIKRSLVTIKKHWLLFLVISVLSVLIGLLGYLVIYLPSNFLSLFSLSSSSGIPFLVKILIGSLIGPLLALTINAIGNFFVIWKLSEKAAPYREIWKEFLPFLAVSFLSFFTTFFGITLLIIPGIIFGTWFSLAGLVVVYEKKKGIESLLRSKELVKGNTSTVLVRIILYYVLVYLILLPLDRLGLSGFIGNFLLTPFMIELYKDLNARKGVTKINDKDIKKYHAFAFIGLLFFIIIYPIATILFLGFALSGSS